MRRTGTVVLLVSAVALGACASIEHGSSVVRTVNQEELAGCTKVGLLPSSAFGTGDPGDREKLRAQVTSLGGNAILLGNVGGTRTYIEVWSCPEETTANQ